MPERSLVLLGMMGAGKTTVAGLLAQRAACPLHSLDLRVAALAGKSITAIFADDGEDRFRVLESQALAWALQDEAGVIDTGGGVAQSAANRELLAASATDRCYLSASPAVLRERVTTAGDRPMLQGGDLAGRLAGLLAERDANYRAVATVVVEVDGKATPPEVAERVSREVGWCAA